MALVHEFESTGNWLFKRRSWLPVFLILGGIFVLYTGNRQAIIYDMRDEIIFLAVSLLGEFIRIMTVGFTPFGTSGRNTDAGQIAEELNTTGIYSIVRHPLYLGNFLMWLGPVLFLRSVWADIVFCLIYWVYYERIMFAEEQFLRKKFGEAYDKWSETAASFFPHSLKVKKAKLGFSFRNVLKREYNSFVNIFIIFTLLDLFRNWFLIEKFRLTGMWMYLMGAALLIWLVIRVLYKYTRMLEVEGR